MNYIDPTGLECVWDDGSFDSVDDSVTGFPSGCGAAGGNWYDPADFASRGLGDWSASGNSDLAQEIIDMQAGDPNMPSFEAQSVAFGDVGNPLTIQDSMEEYILAPLESLVPKVCGYGGFGYGGGAYGGKKYHVELLGLVEYDKTAGGSHGGLVGGGWGQKTVGVESMHSWSTGKSSTTGIGLGGPEFKLPGPLQGMKGDSGGFLQLDKGQFSIGGFLGGHGAKGRALGGGGYVRLSWSGC